MRWIVSNATLLTDKGIEKNKTLGIVDNAFHDIQILAKEPRFDSLPALNVHGLFVLPGFVNSYDSLLASYTVFKGANHPYNNWLAWDNEIKASMLFRKRMLLDAIELYQLGSYRNAMSGVTSVLDHIPHFIHSKFENQLLPELVTDFCLAHSATSYSLKWGEGIRKEHELSQKKNKPFILQVGNGFDEASLNSVDFLEEENALSEHTVLVHGLSLGLKDLDKIARAGASLVWCPASSIHIYSKTPPIKEALERKINVCLGSDTGMNGSFNLLSNIKTASESYSKKYGVELAPQNILQMLTSNAYKALKLSDKHNPFASGSLADFMVIRGQFPDDPWLSLQALKMEHICLLVRGGEAIYAIATEEMKNFFRASKTDYETFYLKGSARIIKKHSKENGFSSLSDLKKKLDANGHVLEFLPITA